MGCNLALGLCNHRGNAVRTRNGLPLEHVHTRAKRPCAGGKLAVHRIGGKIGRPRGEAPMGTAKEIHSRPAGHVAHVKAARIEGNLTHRRAGGLGIRAGQGGSEASTGQDKP